MALGVVALVVLGSLIYRIWVRDGSDAPYSPEAVDAHVVMSVPSSADRQSALDALAGVGRLEAPTAATDPVNGDPLQDVVGQVTLTVPHNAPTSGQYALFVLDALTGQPATLMFGVGPAGTNVGQGWDGVYNKIAKRYAWLRGLTSVKGADGDTDPGMAVTFLPSTPGPITFLAQLPSSSPGITAVDSDVTVALAFIGGDDTIYWAERVPVK